MKKEINKIDNSILRVLYVLIGLTFFVPLIYSAQFYFPYIVPRNLYFRFTVEIASVLYLILIMRDRSYRPKLSVPALLLVGFVGIMTLTSFTGVSPDLSFWSNFERMDGLVALYHLLAFFIITSSIIKSKKNWDRFIIVSLTIASCIAIIAFIQRLGFDVGRFSASGSRLTGSLGNAIYLAAYLILHIFFLLYFVFKNKIQVFNKFNRILLSILALLFIYIVIGTATRGAIVGLAFGIFLILIALRFRKHLPIHLKYVSSAVIFFCFILYGALYAVRDTSFIQHNTFLHRITSISAEDRTTQSRILTWQTAFQGIAQRPLAGWGIENFNQVFNSNFPPQIYTDEGSPQWFDRPHNLILQYAVEGGLLSVVVYMAFLMSLIGLALKRFKYPGGLFLAGLIVAYFIQNLFVFDTLNSSLIFYFTAAWLTSESNALFFKKNSMKKNKLSKGVLIATISVLVIVISTSIIHVRAAITNMRFVDIYSSQGVRTERSASMLDHIRSSHYLGKAEMLSRFAQTIVRDMQNDPKESQEYFEQFVQPFVSEFEEYIARYNNDARLNMHLLNVYLIAAKFNPLYASRAIVLGEHTKVLTPTRSQIYQLTADVYSISGQYDRALIDAQVAARLAPLSILAHWKLFTAYALMTDVPGAHETLIALSRLGVSPLNIVQGAALIYTRFGIYAEAESLLQKALDTAEAPLELYFSLSDTYIAQSKKEQAAELLEKYLASHPEDVTAVEQYLKKLK